jgi:hypothetical protein
MFCTDGLRFLRISLRSQFSVTYRKQENAGNRVPIPVSATNSLNPRMKTSGSATQFICCALFRVERGEARVKAREASKTVVSWRRETAGFALRKSEIERMASAFEHQDLKPAVART